MNHHYTPIFLSFIALFIHTRVQGSVTTYNNNKQDWQAAVGDYSTIDFTGWPDTTVITEQYAWMGVHFTDGADFIYYNNSFPNDGIGLRGGLPSFISITFDTLQHAVAVDHPGSMQFDLLLDGATVYTSPPFFHGGSGFFAGLVSTTPFNGVRLFNPFGAAMGIYIDDLHVSPIPGPNVLVLLSVVALMPRRRRPRKRCSEPGHPSHS